jgi:hypothetical protein
MVEETPEEKNPLTPGRPKGRIIRWTAVLTICVAIGVALFLRARGGEAPAGKQGGAAIARAVLLVKALGGGWDASLLSEGDARRQ